jgi:protein TonB
MNLDAFPARIALTALVAAVLIGAAVYANRRLDPFGPQTAQAVTASAPAPETWSSAPPGMPRPAALAPTPQKAAALKTPVLAPDADLLKARERARKAQEKQEAARRLAPLVAAIPTPAAEMIDQGGARELPSATAQNATIRPPETVSARLNAINPAAAALYFPARARERGIGGQAVVDCAISAAGTVSDCRVVFEEPRQMGFGAAAERLARESGGRPASLDGEPVDGGRARRTVTFRP